MAKGPKYRLSFRRRREGKTNFHRRLKMIRSHRNRLVIRCSNTSVFVQIAEPVLGGDKILVASTSKQLLKAYNWKYAQSNLPSAYLTGYLCGMRAKKANIEDAILDVGVMIHQDRVKAAFKGFLDAGINIPHDDAWFPKTLDNRINGEHIKKYAEKLSKEAPDKYKKLYSRCLKQNADPLKISEEFKKVKDQVSKLK